VTATLTAFTRQLLYNRAGGRCQCTMHLCAHHRGGHRCPHRLAEGWQAHRISPSKGYVLSNLAAMCKTCHKNTPSFGRS